MTDFPFPPIKDAALLSIAAAGWIAFAVFGIRTLVRRARR
jgi:hypothetical protein